MTGPYGKAPKREIRRSAEAADCDFRRITREVAHALLQTAGPTVLDRVRQVLASACGGLASINVHRRAEEPMRFDRKQRVVCSQAMA
jgi:hypothetical protein